MSPVDYSPPANPTLTPPPHAVVQSQQTAKDGREWRDYTVRTGDNLARLAAQFDTTIAALVAKNKLEDPRLIKTGTTLKVPGAAPKRSTAPATRESDPKRTEAKAPTRWTRTHTVRAGENVSELALTYGTSWRAILKANKISDPRAVTVGQKLRVPTKDAENSEKPERSDSGEQKSAEDSSRSQENDENTFAGRTYPNEVVAAAAKNRDTLSHREVPSRSDTRALIVRTAQKYGVDPRLALGVAWQESGWNQRAVSVANAVGVMQVMPGTGQWCGQMVGQHLDLLDPEDNVTAGVVFLRWLTENADSSEDALAGYYQGLGSVEEHGMYSDTKTYVANVKAHMARF